ncbi:MAG: efflux RND transporter periplasmic adaptor subunit, partial [Candidatus Latescibacterota bacterium]
MAVQKKRKPLWIKITLAVIFALLLVAVVGRTVARGGKEQPVKTVKPKIGKVIERLTETGNIELVRTVEVKSKIAGTVKKILVKEGEPVKKDQILCIVDPDPSQTLLLFQKRASVDRTLIDLDRAKKEHERRRELAKTSMTSPKELEDAVNNQRLAQNAYNLSKLELEIMEREIETTGSGTEERIASSMVRSPIDGVITQRYIEEGVLVTSGISLYGAGTSLFQIGDPSAQIIKANISEVDIGKVKVGSTVRITLDAYADTTFAGKIRHISPVGKLQSGRNVVSFMTEVEIIDKDPRLKPGMSCDVDVILAEADSVLFLPMESVYRKKEGSLEEGNEVTKNLVFVQTVSDSTKRKSKAGFMKFGSKKKTDTLENFTQKEVAVGVASDNRIQVVANFDTNTVLAADAEKMYKDMEAKKKKTEKGKNQKN